VASGSMDLGTTAGAFTPSGAAGGDLSGNYPSPTVATVGGSTAAAVGTATVLANASTAVNTVSTIVKRDGSGNFAAGAITLTNLINNGTGGIAFASQTYSSPVNTIGAAGTGGSLLINTPSANASFNSGLTIDGTYSIPNTVINIKAIGVYSAGGYNSTLAFSTTYETATNVVLQLNPDISMTSFGGVIINTSISRPAAGVAYRGMLWVTQGAGGVTDTLSVCLKAVAGTYSWVTIVTGS
jgi:hypothetical protein